MEAIIGNNDSTTTIVTREVGTHQELHDMETGKIKDLGVEVGETATIVGTVEDHLEDTEISGRTEVSLLYILIFLFSKIANLFRNAGSRHQESGNRDVRHSGNFNRRLNQTPGRNQSGSWQQGGGSWNGGNQNAWSNQSQSWQNWNQNQGTWNNQYKQYSQHGYGQQQQAQQQTQAYGNYANWNYYGHYAENWNAQVILKHFFLANSIDVLVIYTFFFII